MFEQVAVRCVQSRPAIKRTGIYWGSVLLVPSQAAGSSLSLVLCSEPLVRIDIHTDQVRRQRELDKDGEDRRPTEEMAHKKPFQTPIGPTA